jgi:hypothetical protein
MNTAFAYNSETATCPRRSVSAYRQRICREPQRIHYSDRIYACLVLSGKVVAEITRDRIDGYTALLTTLRSLAPGCRGLARLRIRNITRGWSLERPLMLYAPTPSHTPMPWETH